MQYLDENGEVLDVKDFFLRTPYNYSMDAASVASGLDCSADGEGKAQQHFKEECDINTIVRRFGLTGDFPENFNMPLSADITEAVSDFHTAANMILAAEEEFMRLPGELRAEFQNDPGQLIAFLENPENRARAVELKLLQEAPAAPEPMLVRVVPETPPGGQTS